MKRRSTARIAACLYVGVLLVVAGCGESGPSAPAKYDAAATMRQIAAAIEKESDPNAVRALEAMKHLAQFGSGEARIGGVFKLTSLPPEIGLLTNLLDLEIFGNSLTTLPPEIKNLSNLERLHVIGSDLTSLPPEVGELRNLISLQLMANQLSELPAEIEQLEKLRWVDLSDNPIGDATLQQLQSLGQLERLNVRQTNVTEEGIAAFRKAKPKCKLISEFHDDTAFTLDLGNTPKKEDPPPVISIPEPPTGTTPEPPAIAIPEPGGS